MCDGSGRPVWLTPGGLDGAEGASPRVVVMGSPGGATFALYHATEDDGGGVGGPLAVPAFLPPAHLPFPSASNPRLLAERSSGDLAAAKRRRQQAGGSRGGGGAGAEAAAAAGGVLEGLLGNVLSPSRSQPRSLHQQHHHQTQRSWSGRAGGGGGGAGMMTSASRVMMLGNMTQAAGCGSSGAGAGPTLALVLPVKVDGECGCTSTAQVALPVPVVFAPTLQVQMQPPQATQMHPLQASQMHPPHSLHPLQASAVREWGFPAAAVRSLTWPPKSPSGYSSQTSSWPPVPASPSQLNSLLGTSGSGSRSLLQPQRSFGAAQGSSRSGQQQQQLKVEVWKKPGLSMPPCCTVTRCGGLHRSPDF